MECTIKQECTAAFKESGVRIWLMCILLVFDHAIFKKSMTVPLSWDLLQVVFQRNEYLSSKTLLEVLIPIQMPRFSWNLSICLKIS